MTDEDKDDLSAKPVEIDPVTAAFLNLKEDEISSGRAELSGPLSGDDIRSRKIPNQTTINAMKEADAIISERKKR
ncbi:hypothetical protein [Shimia sp.]